MPSDANERTKAVRVTENSFYALVRAFKESAKFKGLAKASQDLWGRELDFACRPNCLGAVPLDVIRPALIQGYLDGWDDKPGKQAAALAAFKALDRWAVVRDLCRDRLPSASKPASRKAATFIGPMLRLSSPRGTSVPTWRAPSRLVPTPASGSATKIVRMGPTDIETYRGIDGINVRQKKTGRQVWVPILAPLAAVMKTWERRPGPFLLRTNGKPWASSHLTDRLDYEKKTNPAIAEIAQAGLVMHGLRGHACVRLRRAGCTAMQIADMIGMSVAMVERYCRFSVQMENAVAGVIQLQGTSTERIGDNVVNINEK
jgi:hypothetical protein